VLTRSSDFSEVPASLLKNTQKEENIVILFSSIKKSNIEKVNILQKINVRPQIVNQTRQ
jgi:hypothetical protein